MSDQEKEKKIKEQFDRYLVDSKVATVGRIRDLLLSDEFLTAFAKKFFSTPVSGGIVALDSNEAAQEVRINNAFGELTVGLPEAEIRTTFNWHGSARDKNEVSE